MSTAPRAIPPSADLAHGADHARELFSSRSWPARILVLLIMTRRIGDLYLYVGQTHVHHLNYGIFLLTAVGAYLLFFPDRGRARGSWRRLGSDWR
jgi:hypothetical protein